MDIRCPICGAKTKTSKIERSDPPCRYYDFICFCNECGLFKTSGAADGYYGREYFRTKDDFTAYIEMKIKKAIEKRCENEC